MTQETRSFLEGNGFSEDGIRRIELSLNLQHPEGTKFDSGKLRWDLVPFDCLAEVVEVYTRGAAKYGANNWMQVKNGSARYFSALMRHLCAYLQNEEFDPEWHTRHLAHVVWNALALLWFQTHPQAEEKK